MTATDPLCGAALNSAHAREYHAPDSVLPCPYAPAMLLYRPPRRRIPARSVAWTCIGGVSLWLSGVIVGGLL